MKHGGLMLGTSRNSWRDQLEDPRFHVGFWENQGTVAGDTGFFRTDDFRMSKRGPMAQEFRNLNRELLDTSRNA